MPNGRPHGQPSAQVVSNRLRAQHRTTIRREGSDFKSSTKFEFTGAIAFGECYLKKGMYCKR